MITSTDRPLVSERFEDVVLPHLEAAYRLARWLTRNEHDAEDIVQEASLRALRYFRTFAGRNARAWFLRIVRNTFFSWRARAGNASTDVFDDEQHVGAPLIRDPETLLMHAVDAGLIDGSVNGVGALVRGASGTLRQLQTGSVRTYAASLFLGVVMILGWYLWI